MTFKWKQTNDLPSYCCRVGKYFLVVSNMVGLDNTYSAALNDDKNTFMIMLHKLPSSELAKSSIINVLKGLKIRNLTKKAPQADYSLAGKMYGLYQNLGSVMGQDEFYEFAQYFDEICLNTRLSYAERCELLRLWADGGLPTAS